MREGTMSKINVKTHITVNGNNVIDMLKSDMIGLIAKSEAEIKTLQAINAKSTAIDAEIKGLNEGIAALVEQLDAKK